MKWFFFLLYPDHGFSDERAIILPSDSIQLYSSAWQVYFYFQCNPNFYFDNPWGQKEKVWDAYYLNVVAHRPFTGFSLSIFFLSVLLYSVSKVSFVTLFSL